MASKCSVCGAPLNNNACDYCGNVEKNINQNTSLNNIQQQQEVQPQVIINNQTIQHQNITQNTSKKSKMAALFLCIFLGYFGVHRFYVGKIGTGILYLFTAGMFGIGWIIDIILIATGSFKDDFDLPLKN
ncbi:MAG: TM2 domain-containing protein [Eubacteriales bacterium]